MSDLFAIAGQFDISGKIIGIQELGSGNVNDTYLVELEARWDKRFILQRINKKVFPHPGLILDNLSTVTDHVYLNKDYRRLHEGRSWMLPCLIKTKTGENYYFDKNECFWRAMNYIEGSKSFEEVGECNMAREAGHSLGLFQKFVCDIDVESLHDTLEGFHITPEYLTKYDIVRKKVSKIEDENAIDTAFCSAFIDKRRDIVNILEDAKKLGRLKLRPIHGDPKISNILFCKDSGRALSIIDLDTVKPGLVHYDLGDCLRSCCNQEGEEAEDLNKVFFNTAFCQNILDGYISQVCDFFSDDDYNYIYDAVRIISFELGLRFFTDYLDGNHYFKVRYSNNNLHRAMVQFRLVESIESQQGTILTIIKNIKSKYNKTSSIE